MGDYPSPSPYLFPYFPSSPSDHVLEAHIYNKNLEGAHIASPSSKCTHIASPSSKFIFRTLISFRVTSIATRTLKHVPHYTPVSATSTLMTFPRLDPMAFPISLLRLFKGRLYICTQNGDHFSTMSFEFCSPSNS